MKKLLLSILFLVCSMAVLNAQVKNLDKLPQPKRDSILKELAKAAILKYNPEFYEKDKVPTIIRREYTEGEKAGKTAYILFYREDEEYYKEYPNAPNLVEVYIWEDSGLVHTVMLQGFGCGFLDINPESETLKNRKREYLNQK